MKAQQGCVRFLQLIAFSISIGCSEPCEEMIAPSDEVVMEVSGFYNVENTFRRAFDRSLTASSCGEDEGQAAVQCGKNGIIVIGVVGSLEPVAGSDDPNGSVYLHVNVEIDEEEPGSYDGESWDSLVEVELDGRYVLDETFTTSHLEISEVSDTTVAGTFEASWDDSSEHYAPGDAFYYGSGSASGSFQGTCSSAGDSK